MNEKARLLLRTRPRLVLEILALRGLLDGMVRELAVDEILKRLDREIADRLTSPDGSNGPRPPDGPWMNVDPATSRSRSTRPSWMETTDALRLAEALVRRLHLAPDTCLYRALARYVMLRRTGRSVRFVMGIRRTSTETITGHAWVEVDGVPYAEDRDAALTVTFSHDGRTTRD